MRTWDSGRIQLAPADACKPPPDVMIKVIWDQLSDAEKRALLFQIWGNHPEVFEEALHNWVGRQRTRRG